MPAGTHRGGGDACKPYGSVWVRSRAARALTDLSRRVAAGDSDLYAAADELVCSLRAER